MKKLNRLLLAMSFLGACSSGTSEKSITLILKEDSVHTKSIPVTDKKEAEFILQNKLNFLNAFYEQSVDPYYGTERWPPECYQENIIGPITQVANGFYSVSKLTLDKTFSAGFCSALDNDSKQLASYYQIWFFCDGNTSLVKQIVPTIKFKELPEMDSICE